MIDTPLYPDPPRARGSDPRSSHEAADSAVASGTVADHEARIAGAVRLHPGETGDEIGRRIGLSNVQVMRRTRELERRGLIRRGDQRKSRHTNRLAVTWFPAEASA